ncbi:hypothetical protein [Streptantibioticus rubrisoli]|uniref:Uncharacterized protein n=1 Tax=Streptantibioticus rubrisoli TaxID=1387313 RepID=A0ABT1PMX2_9ACTN|nr:hypothetical protein [Streptantibioticus rubrisoli]MCQ4046702.1 hypothetical protein [Streptantibioticus rubrisoli]
MARRVRQQRPRSQQHPTECTGLQLDHRDGSMSCSRGLDCPGVALPHRGWADCDLYGPCAHCEGPPVVWLCDRQ